MPIFIQTASTGFDPQRSFNSPRHQQAPLKRLAQTATDGLGAGPDLALAEQLRRQVVSYAVAERNANNAISLAQTGDGGLGSIVSVLRRMREVAQSPTGIASEFSTLRSEIDRIAVSTTYQGSWVLNGKGSITYVVGFRNDDQLSLDLVDVSAKALLVDTASVGNPAETQAALEAIDRALGVTNGYRETFRNAIRKLTSTIANIQAMRTNSFAAESDIVDVESAEESAIGARSAVVASPARAVLAQANQNPRTTIELFR